MNAQLTLATEGLLLRPFCAGDAAAVQALAGDARIADTTATIPHPYPDGVAEQWIVDSGERCQAGSQATFAITSTDSDELLGAISLLDIAGGQAELGYWVGVPYWGRGIATSAVRCLLEYGFRELNLRRIHARCMVRNPASGKVLLRAGFTHTGEAESICGYQQQLQATSFYEILAGN